MAPAKGKASNWGQMLVSRFLLVDQLKKVSPPKKAGKRGRPKGSPKKVKPGKAKASPKKAKKTALKVKLATPKKGRCGRGGGYLFSTLRVEVM